MHATMRGSESGDHGFCLGFWPSLYPCVLGPNRFDRDQRGLWSPYQYTCRYLIASTSNSVVDQSKPWLDWQSKALKDLLISKLHGNILRSRFVPGKLGHIISAHPVRYWFPNDRFVSAAELCADQVAVAWEHCSILCLLKIPSGKPMVGANY